MKNVIYFISLFLLAVILFRIPFNGIIKEIRAENENNGISGIVFTEIMYNPQGADTYREWVEIYNTTSTPVIIDETWKFNDGTNHSLALINGTSTLLGGELAILTSNAEVFLEEYPDFSGNLFDTVMSLNNSSSTLGLWNSDSESIITQTYYDSVWGGNGFSLEKIDPLADETEDNWVESIYASGTPGFLYQLPPEPENQAPIAVAGENIIAEIDELITFDGSASADPDNDELIFNWDFGDSYGATGSIVQHSYSQAGVYTVILSVSDGEFTTSDDLFVTINDIESPVYSDQILINEILPNPQGSDSEAEFIELYNFSTTEVDLVDWQLQDNSTRVYTISEDDFTNTQISANGYFVVYRSQSGIALNNNGDQVKFFSPDNNLIESIIYDDQGTEAETFARDENNQWHWTKTPTPGTVNIITVNQPPVADFNYQGELIVDQQIEFDASDSYDPEDGSLEYDWDFGDEHDSSGRLVSHKFSQAGDYQVKLTITDNQDLADSINRTLNISESDNDSANSSRQCSSSLNSFIAKVRINEILPNPQGSDEAEWIELYSNSTSTVDLTGWQLDDDEGGSRPYKMEEISIKPGEFLVINRSDSGLALNNSSDKVRLISPDDQLVDEVFYENVKEDYSYNFLDGEWYWSNNVTPGEENFIEVLGTQQEEKLKLVENQNNGLINFYSINEVKELEKGNKVLASGVVTVPPGILGKNIFYIADVDLDTKEIFLDSGIQIYSSKISQLPDLIIGDVVELEGKTSLSNGEKKINVIKENLNIIDHYDLPTSEEKAIDEITEEDVGALFSVSGEMVSKEGNSYHLDDGDGEIIVYFKKTTGIEKPKIEDNHYLTITGILSFFKEDYRFLPRFPEDVNVGTIFAAGEDSEVNQETVEFSSDLKNRKIKTYLLFGTIGAVIIVISLAIKFKFLKKT
ncbi:lamin tail domain-containing protein [Patescibacteria group bacterium]|nr:lamin tail domain-containing protein [Patescibacteria group bacterium]